MSKNWNNKNNYHIALSLVVLICSSCGLLPTQSKLAFSKASNQITQTEKPSIFEEQSRQIVSQGQMLPITAIAIIKETVINLEVAKTTEEQSMGLMFREALPDDRGMFFPFEEARITRFWMNNVPVALDMIFVKDNKIIAIADSVPPCTTQPEDCPLYGPDVPVDGVIELRAGRAKSLELAVGDLIEIKYLNTSQ